MARQLSIAVLLLAMLAAAVLATLWLFRLRADDVRPLSGVRAGSAAPAVEDATAPEAPLVSPASATVQREDVGVARVCGVVLDAAGAPVAGASIVIGPPAITAPSEDPQDKPLLPLGPQTGEPFARLLAKKDATKRKQLPTATSAADGTFVLEPIDAGEWLVRATLGTSVSRTVQVSLGQKVDVELRFPANEAVVTGQVRATGVDRTLLLVELKTARFQNAVQLSPDGWYRSFGAAGPCSVRVHQYVATMHGQRRIVIAERAIVLGAGGGPVRCDFDVGAARIDVVIEDPGGTITNDLVLLASGPRSISGEPIELRAAVAGGRGAFEAAPFGMWQIGVSGPSILPRGTESVEVSLARPTAHVVLAVQRAGLVRVRARDAFGQNVPLVGSRLKLSTVQGMIEGRDIGRIVHGHGVAGDFAFTGVPLGPAELISEDRDVEGRRCFVPFEPLPRQPIEVAAGDQNRVEIRVERRALVQLRAVDRVGREDRKARIAVFAGEREVAAPVAATAMPRPSLWSAHLPTGDYRIVVERPGSTREHTVQVGRQNLEVKLRP